MAIAAVVGSRVARRFGAGFSRTSEHVTAWTTSRTPDVSVGGVSRTRSFQPRACKSASPVPPSQTLVLCAAPCGGPRPVRRRSLPPLLEMSPFILDELAS